MHERPRTYSAGDIQLYTETTPRTERGAIDTKTTPLGTLDYTYTASGQLQDVVSSNANGVNLGYRYDDLGRLQHVDDASAGTLRTHSYTYNANGSLATVTYANGLQHAYGYDTLNRLRTLNVTLNLTPLRSYTYALRASGHRRQIVESTGRTATHTYDALYRLTGETVAADPTGQNGAVAYDLDVVGNRLNRTSQISNLLSQTGRTYNARDWLAGDTYDANGNTVTGLLTPSIPAPGSFTDVYDFENRLILRTQADGSSINLSYDADGNRFQKSLFDAQSSLLATHYYLVDTNNHTGYAQVFEERTTTATGTTLKTYTYGADLISQTVSPSSGSPSLAFFLYDGLGSVRALTDATGAITDTYTYDAFGNLLAQTGSTANAYLYRGEQWDADLGLYYNRARYLNPDSGRFWNSDTYEGSTSDPASLHKYLYANANPIMGFDPSGHMDVSLPSLGAAMAIGGIIGGVTTHWANYALGRVTTTADIVQGAAIGALLGPLALLSPALGVGIAGVGIAASAGLTVEVFLNEHSTPGQKVAASALLIASIAGGAQAIKYAQPAAITQYRVLGDRSVASFVRFMRENGIEVVAEEVYVTSPFYSVGRRYDVVIRHPQTGELTGIEIKSTPKEFGKRNTAQFAADRFVNESGGKAFGTRAKDANIDGQTINSTYKIMWSEPE